MKIQVRPRQLSAINIIIIEFIRRISAENIFKQGTAASTSVLVRACRILIRAESGRALLTGWRPPRGTKGRRQAVW